ncbi:hypothetical protein AWB79_06987 [Caballeronia hypogeia]|uniref:Conjugal transfer protein TraA n=1 Tax=Caballeronia hypogeia TaxID=1777140 RepID=A0A158DHF4_9BURK|nr:hypothetical protein [Caballeronia hypogeia]SAK93676.1 hypothetical protein AWB79_06987 [Caballeronia hypogeia]
MSDGKSISVWYTEDERSHLEEAAAAAGYQHLSKYIRDRSLDRGHQIAAHDSVEMWAERQELAGRLAEIERSQKSAQALLAILVFLAHQKATTGELNELVLACEKAGVPADLLAGSLPDMAALLDRLAEDA